MLKHVRALAALAMLVAVTACATAAPRTFQGEFERPADNSRILVMTPDVQLAVLTAAGLQEPREDWSISGRDNLTTAVATLIQAQSHTTSSLDPATAMEGRVGQVIRLHDAVGTSILAINYGFYSVPTRNDDFTWTLGEGVQELATTYNADYALFVTARGSYASAGRVAAMVGLAMLGVGVPLGGQQAFASLVDLRTGNVIWFNVVTASPNQDMRQIEGAASLAETLMRGAPL
ncbi:hypothetical protein [Vitreimonas sp.]|jgi:hypothetical protein|uniref:hypothetical protein n=1 Tax=Vitreimonas sp. TaxID=3069702 RepID=UPI002ED7C6F7